MSKDKKTKCANKNLERLQELNDLLTFGQGDEREEILIKVNDELKDIKKHLENGQSNIKKVDYCKEKINELISEIKGEKDGGQE